MLELRDIIKIYPSGGENVKALKGVSLRFRNNEFVSILGPSGCGKTTMLNIIGGLDKYTEGDLVINGTSTKKFNDRSWDNYRNHTIGFVFQSYNLIPHQTVLQNVELALTLSGVSKGERRRRAKEALAKVGLSSQLKKRPAQMSGGQMQRVAIARAIVNNPDIILADEPTGALDSETSVQVMDILKDIAKDRLVVMVTHNPELAELYSTRIIRMKDGVVMGDSDPLSDEEVAELTEQDAIAAEEAKKKKSRKASMSFATAFGLSLKNLFTKKGRTLLTAFAGSIGIIGIAMIYAVSQGTSDYIDQVQEDTLSAYPLQITSETADMTAIMSGFISSAKGENVAAEESDYEVHEFEVMGSLFGGIGTNDLKSFKTYLDGNMESVEQDVNAVQYSYGITPVIYSRDVNGKLIKANPSAMTSYMSGGMSSSFFSMGIFNELLDNRELIEPQYEMLAGRWPESYDEMLLVLSSRDRLSDMITYTIGLRDAAPLNEAMAKMMRGEEFYLEPTEPLTWTYEELMEIEFKLVGSCDVYRYNPEYELWEDMSDDTAFMERVYAQSPTLKIVGVACPNGDNSGTTSTGFCYLPSLVEYVIKHAQESEIVKMQLENIDTNVFSGKRFGEEDEEKGIDFSEMISVDGAMMSSAFGTSISQEAITNMVSGYLNNILGSVEIDTTAAEADYEETFRTMATEMMQGYISSHADENGKAKISISDAAAIASQYMATEAAQAHIKALETKYGVQEGTLAGTFEPLLSAFASSFIMSQRTGGDIGDDVVVPGGDEDEDGEDEGEETGDGSDEAESGEGEEPGGTGGESINPSDHSGENGTAANPVTTPDVVEPGPSQGSSEGGEESGSGENSGSTPDGGEGSGTETGSGSQPDSGNTGTPDSGSDNTGNTPESGENAGAGSEDSGNTGETGEGSGDNGNTEDAGGENGDGGEGGDNPGEDNPDIPVVNPPEIDIGGIVEEIMKITVDADEANVPAAVDNFVNSAVFAQVKSSVSPIMLVNDLQDQLAAQAGTYLTQLLRTVMGSITVDGEKIANAFSFDMSEEDMMRLFSALSTQNSAAASAESNLNKLGYADMDVPIQINIYLRDFEGKERFIAFIDDYNTQMEESGQEEKVIRYTDITGLLMSSVTTIIDAITYVLIAFVAISLIVSSIMIGVITLISVQERTKEIGILRAIGASKRNVSGMFNAETMIIGFTSGAIGVIVTYLICIPVNIILHNITGIDTLSAHLPWPVAAVLVIISMLLTLFAGIIPSRSASKKDPVIALRSE